MLSAYHSVRYFNTALGTHWSAKLWFQTQPISLLKKWSWELSSQLSDLSVGFCRQQWRQTCSLESWEWTVEKQRVLSKSAWANVKRSGTGRRTGAEEAVSACRHLELPTLGGAAAGPVCPGRLGALWQAGIAAITTWQILWDLWRKNITTHR